MFYSCVLYLLSQKVSKSSYNSVAWVIICVGKTAVIHFNRYLPYPIACVQDILEALVEDTKQPKFLPWEFDTKPVLLLFKKILEEVFSNSNVGKCLPL